MNPNHPFANIRPPKAVRLYRFVDGEVQERTTNVGPAAEAAIAAGWSMDRPIISTGLGFVADPTLNPLAEKVDASVPRHDETVARVAKILEDARKALPRVPRGDLEWACETVGVNYEEKDTKAVLLDLLAKKVEG